MTKHTTLLAAAFLAAAASDAFAAKENFERSKPHVNIGACLEGIGDATADGLAQLDRVAAAWHRRIDFLRRTGRPRAAAALLLPAVQGVREAARRAVHRINNIAAGCLRALRLAGAPEEDLRAVQAAREAALQTLRRRRDFHVDSFFDIE